MLSRCIALALTLALIVQPVAAELSANNRYADTVMPTLSEGGKILMMPINNHTLLEPTEQAALQKVLLKKIQGKRLTGRFAKISAEQDLEEYMHLTYIDNAPLADVKLVKQAYVKSIGAGYDLVILPAVIARMHKLSRMGLFADGNRINISGRKNWFVDSKWSGQQPAYSMLLEVYSSQGEWLMTTYGGISVPSYANYKTKTFIRKKDLFKNPSDMAILKEGVAIALKAIFKKIEIEVKER
ncbi:MAG: hypothetical protein COA42_24100 [Alteromonadaceae bacterium]|nr:MAG: hypothetical protein COA42_24100 [Alteromonadaceae bacterium]